MRLSSLGLVLTVFLMTGCANGTPSETPNSSSRSADTVPVLQAKVEALSAEVIKYRQELEDARQQASRFQQQLEEKSRNGEALSKAYGSALRSSGYEAALRLVYEGLQRGDTALVQQLLPAGQYVEAGLQDGKVNTYKGYDSAEALSLQVFTEWARQHPLEKGTFSVIATRPGYAWAVVTFPDGRHFRIFFDGWHVTRILASDRPIDMT